MLEFKNSIAKSIPEVFGITDKQFHKLEKALGEALMESMTGREITDEGLYMKCKSKSETLKTFMMHEDLERFGITDDNNGMFLLGFTLSHSIFHIEDATEAFVGHQFKKVKKAFGTTDPDKIKEMLEDL